MKYWTDDQFQDELYSAIAHGLSDTDATKEDIVIAVENVVKVIARKEAAYGITG